ncbi:hypothetical protein HDK77DRAFT_479891 [Phyllosticta capitalensis]
MSPDDAILTALTAVYEDSPLSLLYNVLKQSILVVVCIGPIFLPIGFASFAHAAAPPTGAQSNNGKKSATKKTKKKKATNKVVEEEPLADRYSRLNWMQYRQQGGLEPTWAGWDVQDDGYTWDDDDDDEAGEHDYL